MYELENDREVLTALTKKVHCKLTLSRLISLFVRIAREEENYNHPICVYVPNNYAPLIFHAIERNFIDELDYINFRHNPDYSKEIRITLFHNCFWENIDETDNEYHYNLALYNESAFGNATNNYPDDFQDEIILVHSGVSQKLIDNIYSTNSYASRVVVFDLLGLE